MYEQGKKLSKTHKKQERNGGEKKTKQCDRDGKNRRRRSRGRLYSISKYQLHLNLLITRILIKINVIHRLHKIWENPESLQCACSTWNFKIYTIISSSFLKPAIFFPKSNYNLKQKSHYKLLLSLNYSCQGLKWKSTNHLINHSPNQQTT